MEIQSLESKNEVQEGIKMNQKVETIFLIKRV